MGIGAGKSAIGLAMVLALSACGGGSGGSGNYVPTIPPPPPTPTPTPTQAGPFGVTADTTFATAGDAEFRWNQAAQTYEMKFGSSDWTALTDGSKTPYGFTAYGTATGVNVRIQDDAQFSYTNLVSLADNGWGEILGAFVFGLPTKASEVPTTGSAQYEAKVSGYTETPELTVWDSHTLSGTARLDFDFGAGTLDGYMDPVLTIHALDQTVALPRYAFSQTVYAKGSTTFSGSFLLPDGLTGNSSFKGFFSGPAAAELGASFSAPFWDDWRAGGRVKGNLKGLWIGKKK